MKTVNGYEIKPDADLSFANLHHANLRSADLSFADLHHANLRSADLSFADLSFADLSYANLRSADLSFADLHHANLPTTDRILNCPWSICHIQYNRIRIGCEYHTTEEWSSFTDEQINNMDKEKALVWWKQNKEIVLFIASRCDPYDK